MSLTIGDGLACCAGAYVLVYIGRTVARAVAANHLTAQFTKLAEAIGEALTKASERK